MTPEADFRPPAARVARNTALRAFGEIVGKLASLGLFVAMARTFDASTLGEYVFALAVVQLLWPVAGFGLDRLLLRDIARDRAAIDRLFYDATGLKLVSALAGTGVALVAVEALDYSRRVEALVLVLGLVQAFGLVATSAQSIFQAFERMEAYFWATVPKTIVSALAGTAVLAAGGGVVAVTVAFLVVGVLGTLVAFAIMYRGFARPRARLRPARWPRLALQAGPLGVQEVLGQVTFRIDTVLLSLMTTAALVGAYGAGYRILEATLFLAWSVANSVLPMYSYLTRDSRPPIDRVFGGSLKFGLVLAIPIGVALLVCARAVVDVLFGLDRFDETVSALRWLALAIAVYPVGHLASALVAVRRPGRVTIASSAAVVAFNVALNLVLIPRYGINGAAIATLASEALLAVLSVWLARPEARADWRWVLTGPVFAGAAMGGVMLPFSDRLAVALPLGAAVYLVALAAAERNTLRDDLAAVRAAARSAPAIAEEPQAPTF
jgi:O-antigen/teichoic acid export membrane protein